MIENEKKQSRIRRNLSFITLGLEGHLFDTKCFNNCIDICEQNQVQFKIVGWDLGINSKDVSKVQITMMA